MSGRKIRVIARLDVKTDQLVKGIQLEGLRKLGDPNEFARRYYRQGIDEILYMDIVASLYGRNSLDGILRRTTEDVFIPITAGGGLRSVEDVRRVLQNGADKAAVNTAAVADPALIGRVASAFGSQCMVLSIEAKRRRDPAGRETGGWEAYTENGRQHTGLDAVEWARQGARLGAGEILLTSVDKEGLATGMDTDLVRAVADVVDIPVIASGGCGSPQDAAEAARAGASAVAVAHLLHYNKISVAALKAAIADEGIEVRL